MNEKVLRKFRQYLHEIGYSKGTQRSVLFCVTEFTATTNKTVNTIGQQDILHFYAYLQQRPLKRGTGLLSNSMLNHYLYAIKVFFDWQEQSGQLSENPTSNLGIQRPKTQSRQPLTQQQIQHLFNTTENIKETSILHLFYSCGLRRTEAENLDTNDIHFHKNILYVRSGKGARRRAIPMGESISRDLEGYLQQRENPKNSTAFMTNQRNSRMSGNSYNAALKRIIAKSNIHTSGHTSDIDTCSISLHHLRHSIATHLLENGMGIEFVRDFLGHKHLEATQVYTKVYKIEMKNGT